MAGIAEQPSSIVTPENLDGSGAAGHATVDAQNPWPGPDAYDEASRDFFRGRNAEAAELLRLIRLAPLTVLYSKSGLGKTSLLQAGLFPLLRKEHYLPVPLRLDFAQALITPPLEQVMQRLTAALKSVGAEYPAPAEGEGVWEYLHRRDAEFWSADNFPLVPVLLFDQFEELFSRTGGNAKLIRNVFSDLADLIENRIPAELASETAGARRSRLDLLSQHYRVLLSFREDFLPDVRTWEKQVPSLLRNALRLEPMTRECAIRSLEESGAAVLEEGVAPYIVDFVGRREQMADGAETPELAIEPVLLSLCCTQLNRRRAPGGRIDTNLVRNAGQDILESFYRGALEDTEVRGEPDVAGFIETYLIQGDHFRGDYPKQEALDEGKLRPEQLSALTDRIRLVRIVYRSDTARIELIHDRLVPVVRKARDQRRVQAAEQEQRRQAQAAQAERDRERAYNAELRRQRDIATRNWKVAIGLAAVALLLAVLAWNSERIAARREVQFQEVKRDATLGWEVERLADGRLALDAKEPLDEMAYRALAAYRMSLEERNLRQALPASLSALQIVLDNYVHLFRIVRLPGVVPTPALGFSPNGETLAIGGEDGVVRLLDLTTFQVTGNLDCRPRATESAWALSFNSDGSRLAVGYSSADGKTPGNGMVCVFDLQQRNYQRWSSREHGEPSSDVFSVAYGGKPGEEFVISGGSENVLRKWDLATGRVLEVPQKSKAIAVAVSPDGKQVAAGGEDGVVRVWKSSDLEVGKPPLELTGHGAEIQQIAFSPANPERLISAGDDGRIMVWNTEGGCRTSESKLQKARIYTTAINADGLLLASGGADGFVRLFQLPGKTEPCSRRQAAAGSGAGSEKNFDVISEGVLSGHGGLILAVAFGPRGDELASAGQDGSIRLWVPDTGSFSLGGLRLHAAAGERSASAVIPGTLTATAVSSDDKEIVGGDSNGNLYVWDRPAEFGAPAMLEARAAWKAHNGPVRSLACFRLGERMAVVSGGADGMLRRWDLQSHTRIGEDIAEGAKAVLSLALSPNGRELAAGALDGTVRLWNAATGEATGVLGPTSDMHSDFELSSVAFSADGKYLAIGSNYKGLLIRDPVRPGWERWLQGQNMGTSAVSHGQKAWLLSSGLDGSLLEWEEKAIELPPGSGPYMHDDFRYRMGSPGLRTPEAITSMDTTADGKLILTGGEQGQIRLWDGAGHVLISDHFEAHGKRRIQSVSLAPDGSFFVTADSSTILVWPGPARWAEILCAKLPWNMSREHWRAWVSPEVSYRKQCSALQIEPDDTATTTKTPSS